MEKLNVWLHQLNNFGKRKTFFQNFPIIALKTNRSLKPGTPVQWNRNKAVGTAVDKRVEFFPVFLPTDHFFFSPFLAPISTLELVSLARGASEVKVARASRGPAISVDFFILLCGLVSVRYENQLPRKPDQKFLFYLSALVFVCIMQPCTFHGGHVPTIFSATNRLHFRP